MSKKIIKILICDDDKYFRMALKDTVLEHALVFEAGSEAAAEALIESEYFDMAIIDMDIDGPLSGIKILKLCKSRAIHSIILSSQNDEEIIEQAYNSGCDHFLAKSNFRTHLEPYIHKYKKNVLNNDLSQFFEKKYITQDAELKNNISELCKINLKSKTIFITGETGVGKSLIGELLHGQTYDESKPFIHLNCSEIPENLIESELFGHEKGAFTGANQKKIGKLELANGGTLFLDEIATMPITMQKKLLKALDQKSFYPLGSDKEVQSEFTLISATCEDLFEKISAGEFRKDLFFRVSGLNLDIKPLRSRKNDIPLLTKFFLARSPRRFIMKECAINTLSKYSWPGNIRELKKIIDLLSTREKGIIYAEDISFNNFFSESEPILSAQQRDFIQQNGLRAFITSIEKEAVRMSLDHNQGKVSKTIKDLQISASAFYRINEQLNTLQ